MKFKLVVAATFTARPLEESLRFWREQFEIPFDIEFAPYGQIFQSLLDPASAWMQNKQGANLALVRIEDWVQGTTSLDDFAVRLEANVAEFLEVLGAAQSQTSAPGMLAVCLPSNVIAQDVERAEIINRLESQLVAGASRIPGIRVLDGQALAVQYQVNPVNDPAADAAGHVPYTPEYFAALGSAFVRGLVALGSPYRAIVADADETLWQGVCGEDGPENVKLTPGHLALQEWLRAQRDAGVKLALASQNSEDDVLAVMTRHPEMRLQKADWSAWRVNWQPVALNLESVADELGLSPAEMVYISSNPVECAQVRERHPETLTLQLPQDGEIPSFLSHIWIG